MFTTTIKSGERVFLVTATFNDYFFCNLEQIEECCAQIEDKCFIVFKHYWNGRFQNVSKKLIIDMLKAQGLNYKFEPLQ